MVRRRRLSEVELVGGRRLIRRLVADGLTIAALVAAVGYVLPAHRLGDEPDFHSNYSDGGPITLVVCAVVIAIGLALRERRFGAGMLLGITATAGAVGAVLPVLLAHFLWGPDLAYGETVFAVGVLAMFFGGPALIVLEVILHVTQRRVVERDDPAFPSARVVSG